MTCDKIGGSITAIMDWLHYGDHQLAPLRRSRNGTIALPIDSIPGNSGHIGIFQVGALCFSVCLLS